jgi:hypothetical protein
VVMTVPYSDLRPSARAELEADIDRGHLSPLPQMPACWEHRRGRRGTRLSLMLPNRSAVVKQARGEPPPKTWWSARHSACEGGSSTPIGGDSTAGPSPAPTQPLHRHRQHTSQPSAPARRTRELPRNSRPGPHPQQPLLDHPGHSRPHQPSALPRRSAAPAGHRLRALRRMGPTPHLATTRRTTDTTRPAACPLTVGGLSDAKHSRCSRSAN